MKLSLTIPLAFATLFSIQAGAYPIDRFCNAAAGRCHGDKTYACSGDGITAKIHIVEKGLDRTGWYTRYDVSYDVKSSRGATLLKGSDWGSGGLDQENPTILNYHFATNPNPGALVALWLHSDEASSISLRYYGKERSHVTSCTVKIKRPTF